MRHKIVFVSGKYIDPTHRGVKTNIIIASQHAEALWDKGYTVICPHLNSAFMGNEITTEEDFLDGCIVMLERCDYIYLLPNWEKSFGALVEIGYALTNGIEIYDDRLDT